jgi:protein-tyrosine phosphatase
MIDIHCHILHSIDDGPDSLELSVEMAAELYDFGYRLVFATPHRPWYQGGLDRQTLDQRCDQLNQALQDKGIDLKVLAAAEHFSSLVPELLHKDDLFCYPRGDSFLMEFPLSGFPSRVDDLLFRCQLKGKVPVIAHVERYPDVQRTYDVLEDLKERGCVLLVNITSLGGDWGPKAQSTAKKIVKAGLVDALTTDMHSIAQLGSLSRGRQLVEQILEGPQDFSKLTTDSPAEICGVGL